MSVSQAIAEVQPFGSLHVLSASFTGANITFPPGGNNKNLSLILGLAIGIGGAVIIGVVIFLVCRWRKKNQYIENN
jgi:hypothetical protein